MKQILIIHPDDESTDFLKPIYAKLVGKEGVTVINGGVSKEEVRDQIEKSDQVIMLGHGTPGGLLAMGLFYRTTSSGTRVYGDYIIDETMVAALGNKPNNIYIWCNADRFVNHFFLHGFYSGMFISEYGEADYCRVITEVGDVEVSNNLFSEVVGENILLETKELHNVAVEKYNIENNKVNDYNRNRLYWR